MNARRKLQVRGRLPAGGSRIHHRPAWIYFQSHILGGGNVPGYGPRLIASENAAIAFPAGRSRTNIFWRVLARLQNPELQGVADLRRHAAALQRAHPFRCLIQLATAGRSATNVDWSITWLPARRRDGFGLRSCRARRRARTRSATTVQHWPSFFASEKPSGKRCDARGPSRNRPTVAPPIPRTEGKLPRNVVRDKRWRRSACGCKNHPQPALLFFSGQKCDGCIFGRDGRI